MAQCGAATLSHFDILKFFGRDPWVASLQKASGREDVKGNPIIPRVDSHAVAKLGRSASAPTAEC